MHYTFVNPQTKTLTYKIVCISADSGCVASHPVFKTQKQLNTLGLEVHQDVYIQSHACKVAHMQPQ